MYIQYVQIYLNWFLVVYMLTKINMRLWRIVCYLRYVSIIISTLCKLTGSLFSKHILDDLSLIFRLLPITINSILHTFNSELFIVSVEILMSSWIKIFKTYGYQKWLNFVHFYLTSSCHVQITFKHTRHVNQMQWDLTKNPITWWTISNILHSIQFVGVSVK